MTRPRPVRAGVDDTHECPARRCTKRVRADLLMCVQHWHMVPKRLRDAVWAAWADGAGAGTTAHAEAITAAVDAVNAKLAT